MPEEGLDERYLSWLYSQVANVKTRVRARTHWKLFRQLHRTIFVATVSHDENRIEDARDLRYEFLTEHEDVQGDPDWTRSPCTMLELLIVLSRQLAFEMDDPVAPWFWHLIEVLELEQFNDREYNEHSELFIAEALDRVIWRTYAPNGQGGLFPLRNPPRDQRQVELWYQLNAYLLEQF
jgi:hypothetical protein